MKWILFVFTGTFLLLAGAVIFYEIHIAPPRAITSKQPQHHTQTSPTIADKVPVAGTKNNAALISGSKLPQTDVSRIVDLSVTQSHSVTQAELDRTFNAFSQAVNHTMRQSVQHEIQRAVTTEISK